MDACRRNEEEEGYVPSSYVEVFLDSNAKGAITYIWPKALGPVLSEVCLCMNTKGDSQCVCVCDPGSLQANNVSF